MPLFPEFHEDEFSVMVDPFTGRVALICPAPIMTFTDANEFRNWLSYLLETIPNLMKASTPADSDPAIDRDYATAVIDLWQEQIMDNLKLSQIQKKTERKKSVKKPKNSTKGE